MVEEWKDIVIEKGGQVFDYTGLYQVSNLGRVRSLDRIDGMGRKVEEKILKLGNNKGYQSVFLHKNGKAKIFQVHRLVATAFIPNPDNLPVVNHKDENPSNNCVDNLEWCTQKYNINYGTSIERMSKTLKGQKRSEKTRQKISDAQKGKPKSEESKRKISETKSKKVICLETKQVFNSTKEAKQWLGSGDIKSCLAGNTKSAGGYHWMYYEDYMTQQENVESFN